MAADGFGQSQHGTKIIDRTRFAVAEAEYSALGPIGVWRRAIHGRNRFPPRARRLIYFFRSNIFMYSIVFSGDDIVGNFIQSLYASFN